MDEKMKPYHKCDIHTPSSVNRNDTSKSSILCECGKLYLHNLELGLGGRVYENLSQNSRTGGKTMRLIDSDNLVAGIEKLKNSRYSSGNERILLETILTVIMLSKTIATVKQGHWIKRNSMGSATCSICGALITNFYDKNSNKYCHVCGAIMGVEDNEKPKL